MDTIRILIGVLGMDRHELGAIAVSRLLREAGMEVIYIGTHNLPSRIIKTSLEEDVDLIGLSCHSWEYLHYMPELLELLKERGSSIPVVVGGSVITRGDMERLRAMGVAAAFGPSSTNEEIIKTIQLIAPRRN